MECCTSVPIFVNFKQARSNKMKMLKSNKGAVLQGSESFWLGESVLRIEYYWNTGEIYRKFRKVQYIRMQY